MREELWQYLPIVGVILLGVYVAATLPSKKRQKQKEEEQPEDDEDG